MWCLWVRAAWETAASDSERVIDSCHLLHELAELPAAWVAVTHVLGRRDHGADALPICVLCRAVDLPALLWAGIQSLRNQKESLRTSIETGCGCLLLFYHCCHPAEFVKVVTGDRTFSSDITLPNISKLIYI